MKSPKKADAWTYQISNELYGGTTKHLRAGRRWSGWTEPRTDDYGRIIFRASDGEAAGQPQWEQGDFVAFLDMDRRRVVAIGHVVVEAYWTSGRRYESVFKIDRVDFCGPTMSECGIPGQQGSHHHLTDYAYHMVMRKFRRVIRPTVSRLAA